jgi:iron complex transport system ATP-binding protein
LRHAAPALTSIVVLHDLNLAARFCDQIILIESGTVTAKGTPIAVLDPAQLERVFGVSFRRYILDGQVPLRPA